MSARTNLKTWLAIGVFFLGMVCTTAGQVITVDDDGPADYRRIQDAINAASNGDTVIVADGTYTGDGNRDIDFGGRAITVRSTDPNDPNIVATTVIDCQGLGRGFYFHSGEDTNSVLDGFTITGGCGKRHWRWGGFFVGGGICCRDSGPKIANCVITRNRLPGHEYCCSYMVPGELGRVMSDGAGIYCSGDGIIVSNCEISHNATGIWTDTCEGRSSYMGAGGGIYCQGNNNLIVNCTIKDNCAGRTKKHGTNQVFSGGGVYAKEGTLIKNCTIISNLKGGGICGSPTIKNCTIVLNVLNFRGVESSGNPTVSNSIIWRNEPKAFGSSASISYSIVESPTAGPGNIYDDPRFTPDFHLRSHSPCINTGDPNDDGVGETDIDGERRLFGGRVDIGSDEFVDSDSDRLPDFWEREYFGSPTAGLTDGDNDGDGYTNVTEYDDYSSNPLVPPRVYYVDANRPDDIGDGLSRATAKRTIQAAIDTAGNSDKIIVADGIYTGEGNRDIDFKRKTITLTSDSGPENCIIDCNGTDMHPHRGFYFHSGENELSSIDGFTITNGYGLYEPVFGNSGGRAGGAVYCIWSGPKITNCRIVGNEALYGGGIYWLRLSPILTACTFAYNLAGDGGAIGYTDSGSVIANCMIANNWAYGGGGISCRRFHPGDYDQQISNCTITGNVAVDIGGAVSCFRTSPQITNCKLNGNVSMRDGGAIWCLRASPEITNCTVSGNLALEKGGAICSTAYGSPAVTNCILWGNTASQGSEIALTVRDTGATPAITISYTNVQGGEEAAYLEPDCTLIWGPGNTDVDPCFVEPGYWADANDPNILIEPNDPNAVWVEGDYHLLPGSPCINAGDNNSVPADTNDLDGDGNTTEPIPWDLDGNPRFVDGDCNGIETVDMGAYEYRPPIIVDDDGPADYSRIQDAVNAASNGDTVVVADGTYSGEGNRNIDFKGKAITVKSENGAEKCIIDCNGFGRGFRFHSGEDARSVLEGFTITNGVADSGGGIYCSSSSPTISNCDISSNSASGVSGGGIYFYRGSPTVTNCTLSGNSAGAGGGIFCDNSSPIIANCIISGNSARGSPFAAGGGIMCDNGSNATIANCTISANSARGGIFGAGAGGGIMCFNNSNAIIKDCTITGNTSGSDGGGITCWESSLTIINCTITANTARFGGGINCSLNSVATVTNCTISSNTAQMFGGGLVGGAGPVSDCIITGNYAPTGAGLMGCSGPVTNCTISGNRAGMEFDCGGGLAACNGPITNCTVSGNYAAYGGGLFWCDGPVTNCTISGNSAEYGGGVASCDGPITNCTISSNYAGLCGGGLDHCEGLISNCIVWNNAAGEEGDQLYESDAVTYSCAQGGWPHEGNIDADPCFVEPGYWCDVNNPNIVVEPNDPNAIWVEGDYHLLGGSLCINAGDPNDEAEPNETDLDGKPRIIDGRIDMGAYEFLNTLPAACIVDGNQVVEAEGPFGARVTLDGSCSSDSDSTPETNDDIVYFDWYRVDPCEPNDIFLVTGEIIECNLPLGEHIIVLEVTDRAGAFDADEVTIIVQDTTPPVLALNGPAMVVLECGVDSYTELGVTATDICDPDVPVVIGGDMVDTSTCGTYVVTYDAADDSGNSAEQVTRTVIVQDTIPPEFALSVTPKVLWPPNHKMVPVTVEWTVSDNCDESPEVSLVSISSNEDDDSKGDGRTNNDIEVGNDGAIYLRAERSGTGTGRVYTITYQAVDDSGNVGVASATVTVPHDQD